MWTYVTFFLILSAFLKLHEIEKVKGFSFLFMAYFLIFIFSAIRFDVGYDYHQYYKLIRKEVPYYKDSLARLEPLNQELIRLVQSIGEPQVFFIITSGLITYGIFGTVKRYSRDTLISTLIFISFPIFFLNSLSIIRQFLAVSLVFYSFRYIISRKVVWFVLVVTLATMFHKSAIVSLLLYPIFLLKYRSVVLLVLFILGLIFSTAAHSIVEIVFPQFLHYLTKNIGIGGQKLLFFYQALGLIILVLASYFKGRSQRLDFYLLTFFIGLFIWSSLAPYGHAGFRGGLYFLVFSILLIPELIYYMRHKEVLRFGVFVGSLAFFIFSLWLGMKNENKDPNIPYRVFFLSSDSEFKE